ncbi:hypothetical protein FRC03_006926 [Tulasnella sp. 419]|nr:hypothetical protein FRC03_006926 [Tulasnella sp. 419]
MEWKALWREATLLFLVRPRQFDGQKIAQQMEMAIDSLRINASLHTSTIECLHHQHQEIVRREILWKKEKEILDTGIDKIVRATAQYKAGSN